MLGIEIPDGAHTEVKGVNPSCCCWNTGSVQKIRAGSDATQILTKRRHRQFVNTCSTCTTR